MNIISVNYTWKGKLNKRFGTKRIVLHHAAISNAPVTRIHQMHLDNGWAGIGYHFYIRKDGSIYKGRPIDKQGAHCTGYNQDSIGICFEGNFETEYMTDAQVRAGQELISDLKAHYPGVVVQRHKDLFATACPGKHFLFDRIKDGLPMNKTLETANDITWELSQRIKINDIDGFVKALEKAKAEDSPLYWGYYKIVNE